MDCIRPPASRGNNECWFEKAERPAKSRRLDQTSSCVGSGAAYAPDACKCGCVARQGRAWQKLAD